MDKIKDWLRILGWLPVKVEPVLITGPDEVVPGYAKPTIILANMIAADLIRRGVTLAKRSWHDDMVLACVRDPDDQYTISHLHRSNWYTIEADRYKIRFLCTNNDMSSMTISDSSDFYPNDDFDSIKFGDSEKNILINAIRKALTLQTERDKVRQDSINQSLAVAAIEQFMGVGKLAKPDPDPDLPPCGVPLCGGDDCGGLCRHCD